MSTMLLTFVILGLIGSTISSEESNATETFALAIDVSKTIRLKLDGVRTSSGGS